MSASRKGKAVASGSSPPPPPKRPRSNLSEGAEARSKHHHDSLSRKFRDPKAAADYEKLFKERSVVRDRVVVLAGDNIPSEEIVEEFMSRGWMQFNQILGTGYEELTREFYANFRANTDSTTQQEAPFTSYLRNKTIPISREILRKLLRLPEAPENECEYTQFLAGFTNPENEDRVAKVLETCCMAGKKFDLAVDGTPRFVKKGSLNLEATAWCHFILSSLLPVKHATEIVVKRMVLIYAIMEGLYVDLPRLILDEMCQAANKKVHLPYCSIVTQLAKLHKVDVALEGGRKIQPELPIDQNWLNERIYTGALKRIYRTEDAARSQPQTSSVQPQMPSGQPQAPPAAASDDVMREIQAVKRMQLGIFDVLSNLTRQMAALHQFDADEVLGATADRDQWMASIGFTIPPSQHQAQPDEAAEGTASPASEAAAEEAADEATREEAADPAAEEQTDD